MTVSVSVTAATEKTYCKNEVTSYGTEGRESRISNTSAYFLVIHTANNRLKFHIVTRFTQVFASRPDILILGTHLFRVLNKTIEVQKNEPENAVVVFPIEDQT